MASPQNEDTIFTVSYSPNWGSDYMCSVQWSNATQSKQISSFSTDVTGLYYDPANETPNTAQGAIAYHPPNKRLYWIWPGQPYNSVGGYVTVFIRSARVDTEPTTENPFGPAIRLSTLQEHNPFSVATNVNRRKLQSCGPWLMCWRQTDRERIGFSPSPDPSGFRDKIYALMPDSQNFSMNLQQDLNTPADFVTDEIEFGTITTTDVGIFPGVIYQHGHLRTDSTWRSTRVWSHSRMYGTTESIATGYTLSAEHPWPTINTLAGGNLAGHWPWLYTLSGTSQGVTDGLYAFQVGTANWTLYGAQPGFQVSAYHNWTHNGGYNVDFPAGKVYHQGTSPPYYLSKWDLDAGGTHTYAEIAPGGVTYVPESMCIGPSLAGAAVPLPEIAGGPVASRRRFKS